MPWTRNLAVTTLIITLLLAGTALIAEAEEYEYIVESDNGCKCLEIYVRTNMYKEDDRIYLKLYVKAEGTGELSSYSKYSEGVIEASVKIVGPDGTVLAERKKILKDIYTDIFWQILGYDRPFRDDMEVGAPVVGSGTYEAQITLEITGTLVKKGEEVDKIS